MIVPSIHKRPRQSTKCPHCKTELEFEKPSATTLNSLAPEETLQIKCAECLKVFEGPKEEKKSMSVGKSRRIGTGEALLFGDGQPRGGMAEEPVYRWRRVGSRVPFLSFQMKILWRHITTTYVVSKRIACCCDVLVSLIYPGSSAARG